MDAALGTVLPMSGSILMNEKRCCKKSIAPKSSTMDVTARGLYIGIIIDELS